MYNGTVSPAKHTLMLVESSPQRAHVIKTLLEDLGFSLEILVFACGADALEHLRGVHLDPVSHARPHLVWLSLDGDHRTAADALQKIKTDPHWKVLPVVVFSDSAPTEDVQMFYQLQASAFVVKPQEMAQLKQTINAWGQFWLRTAELPKQV